MNTPAEFNTDECEIVIPIVLRITIYVEVEVVDMPIMCNLPVSDLEPDVDLKDVHTLSISIPSNECRGAMLTSFTVNFGQIIATYLSELSDNIKLVLGRFLHFLYVVSFRKQEIKFK